MPLVQILLFDGFDELDAIAPFEVLRRAARESDLRVEFVTADGSSDVEAAYGLRVGGAVQLAPESPPDLLVVPGGGWNDHSKRGVRGEYLRDELPELIARVHRTGSTIASVCTGAMLLAKAGILAGRPATTHHSARDALQEYGVRVSEARVVDDGDVITAGGVTSGLDLALHLVERLINRDVADAIAERMEYPCPPLASAPGWPG